MSINKKTKEELELMSNKDIAYEILEDRVRSINTADLFKKIIKLLSLPDSIFEEKIGDFYTTLSTDKRFVLLENGNWDLRNRHSSEKTMKDIDTLEDEEDEEELDETIDSIEEDNYDSNDEEDDYIDTEEDIKDLIIIDESELEQD